MITASVVVYHTPYKELDELIQCVLGSSIGRFYIVDNSSNDELRTLMDASNRIVYIKSDNLGFGSGHNIAIRRAIEEQSDYHVVINPDISWEGDIIAQLGNYMDAHQDCGLVMPKVFYPTGEVQYLCKALPTPFDLLVRRFIPIRKFQLRHDYDFELRWTGYDQEMEVPSLSGCFMFMRTSVLKKIGAFDERFFMYAEDLYLCRRIGEVSSTMYYPAVSIVHRYDKGSYRSPKLLRYHLISTLKYFTKWGWIMDKKRSERNKVCLAKMRQQVRHNSATKKGIKK